MTSEPIFNGGYDADAGAYYIASDFGSRLVYYSVLIQTAPRDALIDTIVSNLNEMAGERDDV